MSTGKPVLRADGDPDRLAALHRESFPKASWDAEEIAKLLSGPGVFALSLWSDSSPVGFAMLRCVVTECEILTLCIRPKQRRRGFGRELLQEAVVRARALGAREILLEVAEDNRPARALYDRLGFLPRGRRACYYQRENSAAAAALVLGLGFDPLASEPPRRP